MVSPLWNGPQPQESSEWHILGFHGFSRWITDDVYIKLLGWVESTNQIQPAYFWNYSKSRFGGIFRFSWVTSFYLGDGLKPPARFIVGPYISQLLVDVRVARKIRPVTWLVTAWKWPRELSAGIPSGSLPACCGKSTIWTGESWN